MTEFTNYYSKLSQGSNSSDVEQALNNLLEEVTKSPCANFSDLAERLESLSTEKQMHSTVIYLLRHYLQTEKGSKLTNAVESVKVMIDCL